MSDMKKGSVESESKKEAPGEDGGSDSLWSNFKYGLGTTAFLILPSLIPGVTPRQLVMGYGAVLIISVFGLVVWAVVKGFRSSRA